MGSYRRVMGVSPSNKRCTSSLRNTTCHSGGPRVETLVGSRKVRCHPMKDLDICDTSKRQRRSVKVNGEERCDVKGSKKWAGYE